MAPTAIRPRRPPAPTEPQPRRSVQRHEPEASLQTEYRLPDGTRSMRRSHSVSRRGQLSENYEPRGLARHRPPALDARAARLDAVALPSELQAILERCRADLAAVLAATEPDVVALLADAALSFEALRGLMRRQ